MPEKNEAAELCEKELEQISGGFPPFDQESDLIVGNFYRSDHFADGDIYCDHVFKYLGCDGGVYKFIHYLNDHLYFNFAPTIFSDEYDLPVIVPDMFQPITKPDWVPEEQ